MVNLFTGTEANELFGGPPSPATRHLLEQARRVPREQCAALLWTAAASSPGNLPVYYLLYKLHSGLGELEPALQAAGKGLSMAARAAGLPQDWALANPGDSDFSRPGPARFWLFTLKAMAFIRLRQGQPGMARQLLAQICRLDPEDQIGAGVVADLLERS